MYVEAHRYVADLLDALNKFAEEHPEGDNTPFVAKVSVHYPNDDTPLGVCIDEIGGAFCFIPWKDYQAQEQAAMARLTPDGTFP